LEGPLQKLAKITGYTTELFTSRDKNVPKNNWKKVKTRKEYAMMVTYRMFTDYYVFLINRSTKLFRFDRAKSFLARIFKL